MEKKSILSILMILILLLGVCYIPTKTYAVESTSVPSVSYSSHLENNGWEKDFGFKDGETSGLIDKELKMEAIKIKLNNVPTGASISYQVHVENDGWKSYVSDGNISGTMGRNLKIEAIKIKLKGLNDYDVMYRAYIEGIGWQGWVKNDEIAGTSGQNKRLYAFQIKIVPKTFSVNYYSYIAGSGWEKEYSKKDGQESGTTGKNLKLEALKIKLSNAPTGASLTYQAHVQNVGWQSWVKEGQVGGVVGQGLKVEAIKIKLTGITGYSIQYRVHVQDIGWQDWVMDGAEAGTTGRNLKIEAIQIRIIKNDSPYVAYSSHVQDIGWENEFSKIDGTISGTTGRNLKVEAMKIKLVNAPSNAKITYQSYIQNNGWQNWKQNGELTGTTGKNLKLEAIKIKLEGIEGYTIRYRTHIQDIGWQNWVTSGQVSGTVGRGLKIEAIQIQIVPSNGSTESNSIKKGIDVSVYQGAIDWNKVKQDGVDFAMIRAGFRGYGVSSDGIEGKLVTDSYYVRNMKGATNAGIEVGVYFFTQAINEKEAIEEAEYVLSLIKGYNVTYPIAIDVEDVPNAVGRADNLTKEQRTKVVKAFCNRIEQAGYEPMIYANKYWLKNQLDMSKLSNYSVWLAHYTGATQDDPLAKPSDYEGKYIMWQYTDSGTVDGVIGNTDMNVAYPRSSKSNSQEEIKIFY